MSSLRGKSSISKKLVGNTEAPVVEKKMSDIREIPLDDIIWYHREDVNGRPIFRDYSHEQIIELADSLYEQGQMKAITVFPSAIQEGKYEVLEGKQRTTAARENLKRYADAFKTIKAEIVSYEKVSANNFQYGDLMYVNTNVYRRQELLPSEYGLAFEMQAKAMNHQGANSGTKQMLEEIAEKSHTSVSYIRTVRRIIPTYCIAEIIEMVDDKMLSMSPVALYLTRLGQKTTLQNQQTLWNFVYKYCDEDKISTQTFFKKFVKTEDMAKIQKAVEAKEDELLTSDDLLFLLKKAQAEEKPHTFKSPSKKALKSIIPAELWGDADAATDYLRKAVEMYKQSLEK